MSKIMDQAWGACQQRGWDKDDLRDGKGTKQCFTIAHI